VLNLRWFVGFEEARDASSMKWRVRSTTTLRHRSRTQPRIPLQTHRPVQWSSGSTSESDRIVIPRLHDTIGCQTGLYNWCDNRVEGTAEQPLFVQPVVKPGCTTSLTTGCIHNTAGCQTRSAECLYTRYNPLDNRLYRVNRA